MGLHINEHHREPIWERPVIVSYTDFSVEELSADIEIYSLPAGCCLHQVVMKLNAHFTSSGLLTTLTNSVGITGNLTKYIGLTSIKVAPSSTTPEANATPNIIEDWNADKKIRSSIVCEGSFLNLLTAGEIEYHFLVSQVKA